jgi:hypothetical protein
MSKYSPFGRSRSSHRSRSIGGTTGRSFRPRGERLEERLLLSVSAQAQHFVYLLNLARHDPAAYEDSVGLPDGLLDGVAPRPPLAVSDALFTSAEFHADEMATHDYFAYQSAVTSDWPNKMARDAGYVLPGNYPDDTNYIESLAAGYNTGISPDPYSRADEPLRALILDDGIDPPGHRNHLLGIGTFNADNREVGVGYAYNVTATYRNYWAIHATRTDPSDTFLTGVAFDDVNGNDRYDMDEGIVGVTVTAGGSQTTTNAMGGWSIAVTSGTYTVAAFGSGFSGRSLTTVSVGNDNVEVDFVSGVAAPMVAFEYVAPPDRIGVHRGDRFFLDANASGTWDGGTDDVLVIFGAFGDQPIRGDWNGDGRDDIGVQRGDRFYLDANGNGVWDTAAGGDLLYRFGALGDQPLSGDWNGNGVDTIGIHRGDRFFLDVNGNGQWDGAVGGDRLVSFGAVGDTPLVGDWAGEGRDLIGIHRGNLFFLDVNGNDRWDGEAGGDARFGFGAVGDTPLTGDWNGDGRSAVGVHRGDRFYLDFNGNTLWDGLAGGDELLRFGAVGDTPAVGRWAISGGSLSPPAVFMEADTRATAAVFTEAEVLATAAVGPRAAAAVPNWSSGRSPDFDFQFEFNPETSGHFISNQVDQGDHVMARGPFIRDDEIGVLLADFDGPSFFPLEARLLDQCRSAHPA